MKSVRLKTLFAASLILCNLSAGQVLKHSDLHDDPDEMPGVQTSKTTIDIGPGMKLGALIEESSKGNGVLTIANLSLKVIDEHDDGAVYEGGMAHVEFTDIDGDGWKDLVVTGIADYTGDKDGTFVDREPFTFIYMFDPKARGFRLAYKFGSFDLENGPQARAGRH